MAKLVHHVTLELFAKAGEALATTERVLDTLAPIPLATVRESQWRWHPTRRATRVYELPGIRVEESETEGEEGVMTVISYRFSRQRDINAFLAAARHLFPALLERLDERLDGEGRLNFRLNKEALHHQTLSLQPGPSVMVRLKLAAYPKNEATCRATAQRVLGVKV